MPKSFLSDDPFAAALEDHPRGRRPASAVLFLLVPVLGLALVALGMQARHGAGVPILAADVTDHPSDSERRANHLTSIEAAHRNVLYWQRENCCGAATPHSRAKLRAWERGYQQRLALFARKYPR